MLIAGQRREAYFDCRECERDSVLCAARSQCMSVTVGLVALAYRCSEVIHGDVCCEELTEDGI